MQPTKSKGGGAGPEKEMGGLEMDCLTFNFLSFLPPPSDYPMRSIFS